MEQQQQQQKDGNGVQRAALMSRVQTYVDDFLKAPSAATYAPLILVLTDYRRVVEVIGRAPEVSDLYNGGEPMGVRVDY